MTDKAYVTERKPTPSATVTRRRQFRALWKKVERENIAAGKTPICSRPKRTHSK